VKLYKVLRVTMNLREGTVRVRPTLMTTSYNDYIPVGSEPGRWTREVKNPRRCISGWHLTTNPAAYIRRDNLTAQRYLLAGGTREFCVVFEAEGRKASSDNARMNEKYCFGQIRLLREVQRQDWPQAWHDKAAGTS